MSATHENIYIMYTPDELREIHERAEGIRGRLELSPEYSDYLNWLNGIPVYLKSLDKTESERRP